LDPKTLAAAMDPKNVAKSMPGVDPKMMSMMGMDPKMLAGMDPKMLLVWDWIQNEHRIPR